MFAKCVAILVLFSTAETARILVVAPFPSISHQVVFRPLIQELIKHHEVTVMTTDPIYQQGAAPINLTEIDVHDLSYKMWQEVIPEFARTDQSNLVKMRKGMNKSSEIFIEQIKHSSVQTLIKDKMKKFDLLILEACPPSNLIFSHIFKAPVIWMSTSGAYPGNMKAIGAPTHPLLYPGFYHKKIYNLTILEKLSEFYSDVAFNNLTPNQNVVSDKIFKGIFGMETPDLRDLERNIHMLFLNVHAFWSHNQPVPLNVVYTWGIRKLPSKILPQEIQSYLDSSKHGVIYVSFGTNFKTSGIPPEILEIFVHVFSRLPYNILWKWDTDELPGKSENIKISKWFPQWDILRHPNLKLFITHGGLQSIDEAINAGTPLIGIPLFVDQEFNTEKFKYFGIGTKLNYKTLTIDKLDTAVKSIFTNYQSYKNNIIKLRTQMNDQPRAPMDNTIHWIDYMLRHGELEHLRAPAANMSWMEYYEVELVLLMITVSAIVGSILLLIIHTSIMRMLQLIKSEVMLKKCPTD